MVSCFCKFFVSEWKILEKTNYYVEDYPSSWHIYGKLFGLFWAELLKRKSFVSPYSFTEVNFGYESKEDALHKILEKVGYASASSIKLVVEHDRSNPRSTGKNMFRFNVVESRFLDRGRLGFSVARGFYRKHIHKDVFEIVDYVVENCETPSEAIMKASLMGITVDNPNRFRK